MSQEEIVKYFTALINIFGDRIGNYWDNYHDRDNLNENVSNFEKQKKVIGNILSKIKPEGICGFEIKKDDELDRVGTITIVYSDTQYFRNPGESYEFLVNFRQRIHKLLDSLGLDRKSTRLNSSHSSVSRMPSSA